MYRKSEQLKYILAVQPGHFATGWLEAMDSDCKCEEESDDEDDKEKRDDRQTPKQQNKIHKVMSKFKDGKLQSGKSGQPVKDRKQAIAIALSEAGVGR